MCVVKTRHERTTGRVGICGTCPKRLHERTTGCLGYFDGVIRSEESEVFVMNGVGEGGSEWGEGK